MSLCSSVEDAIPEECDYSDFSIMSDNSGPYFKVNKDTGYICGGCSKHFKNAQSLTHHITNASSSTCINKGDVVAFKEEGNNFNIEKFDEACVETTVTYHHNKTRLYCSKCPHYWAGGKNNGYKITGMISHLLTSCKTTLSQDTILKNKKKIREDRAKRKKIMEEIELSDDDQSRELKKKRKRKIKKKRKFRKKEKKRDDSSYSRDSSSDDGSSDNNPISTKYIRDIVTAMQIVHAKEMKRKKKRNRKRTKERLKTSSESENENESESESSNKDESESSKTHQK